MILILVSELYSVVAPALLTNCPDPTLPAGARRY